MLDAARRELQAAGVTDGPEVVLADAGYWHHEQMERIVATRHPGADPAGHQPPRARAPAAAGTGGLYAFMRRVLATDRGGELYGKRQPMIEPVFANTKFNRGSTDSTDEAEPPSGPNGG